MKSSYFLIMLIFTIASCKKIRPNELTGNWEVVEYAKYIDGEEPVYQTGLTYFFLLRYAQGMQINDDRSMLHRFSSDGNTWTTSPSSSYGTWEIKNKKIIFSIYSTTGDTDEIIEAEVLKWKDGILWIRYKNEDFHLEYKLKKE